MKKNSVHMGKATSKFSASVFLVIVIFTENTNLVCRLILYKTNKLNTTKYL